jgi:hypothetical protein
MVTVGAGPSVRLDDVLPLATVVLTTVSGVVDLGAPLVEVAPAHAPASDPRVRSGSVLPDWFTGHNARFAVVRPDRYVYGTADTAAAASALVHEIAPAGQPVES